MANVTVDFDQGNGNIIVRKGARAVTKHINTLKSLLNPGIPWRNPEHFISEQKYINYLDTIKDGVHVKHGTVKTTDQGQGVILGQITVTPPQQTPAGDGIAVPNQHAMYGNMHNDPVLPRFPDDLNALEERIIQDAEALGLIEESSGLPRATGKARLASLLLIDKVFHDCGNLPDAYCQAGFKNVNNFAQYIDPASDIQFNEVYPPIGNRIEFTNNFMKLFALGGDPGFESNILATASGLRNFDYDINCYGTPVGHQGPRGNDQNLRVSDNGIFIGNNEKNQVIRQRYTPVEVAGNAVATATAFAGDPANFTHCRNLLAAKEWGDKMQVLSVLVFKMLEAPGSSYILLTNDKVVFALAISLGVRVIWSSTTSPKIIKHFNPTTTAEIFSGIKASFMDKRKKVFRENLEVIKRLQRLRTRPGDELERKGGTGETNWHFSQEFYDKIIEDLIIINDNFLKGIIIGSSLNRYAEESDDNKLNAITYIRRLKEYLEYFTFKDIISQTTTLPKKRSFTTKSDRYTKILLPVWTTAAAAAGGFTGQRVGQNELPPQGAIGAVPAEWASNPPLWNHAHLIYNLPQLVTLMIQLGAKIGGIFKKRFDAAAAAAAAAPNQLPVPPQCISFFYAARPWDLHAQIVHGGPALTDNNPPHAWRGDFGPQPYQQSLGMHRRAIIGGGPKMHISKKSHSNSGVDKPVSSMRTSSVDMAGMSKTVKEAIPAVLDNSAKPFKVTRGSNRTSLRLQMVPDRDESSESSSEPVELDKDAVPVGVPDPHAAAQAAAHAAAQAAAQADALAVIQAAAQSMAPLSEIDRIDMERFFLPTELNKESFNIRNINKRTNSCITIDINKRLRDIIRFKIAIVVRESLIEDICKEFLETSKTLYIHEFDEEILPNEGAATAQETIQIIVTFNQEIDDILKRETQNPGFQSTMYKPHQEVYGWHQNAYKGHIHEADEKEQPVCHPDKPDNLVQERPLFGLESVNAEYAQKMQNLNKTPNIFYVLRKLPDNLSSLHALLDRLHKIEDILRGENTINEDMAEQVTEAIGNYFRQQGQEPTIDQVLESTQLKALEITEQIAHAAHKQRDDHFFTLFDLIYEQIYPLPLDIVKRIKSDVLPMQPESKETYINIIVEMIKVVKQKITLIGDQPIIDQAAGDGSGSAGGGKKKKQTKRKKKKNTKRKGKRSNIKKTKNKKKRASNGQKKKKKKTKRGRKSKN